MKSLNIICDLQQVLRQDILIQLIQLHTNKFIYSSVPAPWHYIIKKLKAKWPTGFCSDLMNFRVYPPGHWHSAEIPPTRGGFQQLLPSVQQVLLMNSTIGCIIHLVTYSINSYDLYNLEVTNSTQLHHSAGGESKPPHNLYVRCFSVTSSKVCLHQVLTSMLACKATKCPVDWGTVYLMC